MEAGWIDEGFYEKQGVAVALVPIGRNPFRAEREDFRGEVGLRTAWQDKKPGVVGQSMEALPVKTGRPADPVIAGVRFERCRRKHQQGQPAILHTGKVLDRLANQRGRTKIVMVGEQTLEGVLLILDNRPYHDLPKIDGRMSGWRVVWHAQEDASNEPKKPASNDYFL